MHSMHGLVQKTCLLKKRVLVACALLEDPSVGAR